MATEYLSHIKGGAIGDEAIIITCVAKAAIDLWAPVKLTTAVSGEEGTPRVTNVAAITDKVYGVTVGKLRDSGKAADADGDLIQVCTQGRCKCKVDGNAANIAAGDYLIAHNAAGLAQKVAATGYPFATSLQASTADGDIIAVDVGKAATVVAA